MLPTSKRLVNTILKIGNTHWGLHGHLVVDWKLKWTTDIYMKMDIFDTIVMNWSRHQLVQEIIICQFIIKPNQLVICICHQFLVFKSKQSNHSNDLIKCKLIRQHQKLKNIHAMVWTLKPCSLSFLCWYSWQSSFLFKFTFNQN